MSMTDAGDSTPTGRLGRPIASYRKFDLHALKVSRPDHPIREVHIVKPRDVVAVLALTDQEEPVMLLQYRWPLGRRIWEIPAGAIDEGEDPIEAAERELREETGYTADEWVTLGSFVSSPGFMTERIHAFLARGLRSGQTEHSQTEQIVHVCPIPVSRLLYMIEAGEIEDGKTLAAFALAQVRGDWCL